MPGSVLLTGPAPAFVSGVDECTRVRYSMGVDQGGTMQIDQQRIVAYVEYEYNCTVAELHATPIIGTDAVKVDGYAWQFGGTELMIGGQVNPRNFSGIRTWTREDDPFSDLGRIRR